MSQKLELPRQKRRPISAVAAYIATKTGTALPEVKSRLEQAWRDREITLFGNARDHDGGFEPEVSLVDPTVLPDRDFDWDTGKLLWPGQGVWVMANLSCDMDEIDRWLARAKEVPEQTGGEEAARDKRRPSKWREAEIKVGLQLQFLIEKHGAGWFDGKKPKDIERKIRGLLSKSRTELPDRRLMQQWIKASAKKHDLPIGRGAKRQQAAVK